MTLLAATDDAPTRAHANGQSLEAYLVGQHRARVKRLMGVPVKPETKVPAFEDYARRLADAFNAKQAELMAIHKHMRWRMSWCEMVRRAQVDQLLYQQDVDKGDEAPEPIRVFARDLMREVCAKHGITQLEMKSARRTKRVCRARHEYFWLCRQRTTLSYPQIGRSCGNRDHTTVLHGERVHQARIDRGEAV